MDLDLNPSTITLATFTTLLSSYENTVKEITHTKALAKAKGKNKNKKQPKPKPKTKAQTKKRASSPSAKEEEEEESKNDALSEDAKKQVAAQVSEFVDLDAWRYSVLPGIVEARQSEEGEEGGEGRCFLLKEEVERLMEWKLKHGIYRPMLLGMVRSNQERTIQSATSGAFSQLQLQHHQGSSSSASSSTGASSGKDGFSTIQKSLEILTTPLRGVGPATASLMLSIASREIPFYSDDVYLWLCVGVCPSSSSSDKGKGQGKDGDGNGDGEKGKRSKEVRPNGELNVKYNVPEYRRLWDAVQRLRDRLNEGAREGESVSCADVERVALVVRHFDQFGHLKEDLGNGEDYGEGVNEGEESGKRKRRRVLRK